MATLYLMLGLPGAGKTTTAKEIAELTGAQRLTSDELRLKLFPQPTFSEPEHQQLYRHLDREVDELLGQGKSVIYDANLNRYRHRVEKYELAKKHQAQTVLVWVDVPKSLARARRIKEQLLHLVPFHEDPGSMFDRVTKVFEPPRDNEPYVSIDGTKVTADYVRDTLNL